MILNVILVVLVVLVLSNIGLVFYIKKELEIFEKHFELIYENLIENINKLHLDLYKINGEIFKKPLYSTNDIIVKSSPNIIDLIEVGDYVNGCEVLDKYIYANCDNVLLLIIR